MATFKPASGGGSGSTTIRYVFTDSLSGSSVVTDSIGNLAETLDYYPYGGARIDAKVGTYSGEKRKFIGQYYDELSQLSFLQARYYNGQHGRFISQDPVFWEVGQTKDGKNALLNPQAQNSYSYAEGNPITKSDPNGRFIPQVIALGGLFGGVAGGVSQGISDYQSGTLSSFSTYAGSVSKGAAVGVATAISPFFGAGTAGALSLGTSYKNNGGYITTQDTVNAVANGAVTGLTAGYAKGLPQTSGVQASNIFSSTYYTGAHAQQYAGEAALDFSTGLYYSGVKDATNKAVSNSSSQRSATVPSTTSASTPAYIIKTPTASNSGSTSGLSWSVTSNKNP